MNVGTGPAQVVFRFVERAGIVALTGSTSAAHTEQNLEDYSLELEDDGVPECERLLG